MHIYARVLGNRVMEIIDGVEWPTPDLSIQQLSGEAVYQAQLAQAGQEIPIAQRFTPDVVASLVDVTSVSPLPQAGWLATQSGGVWSFSES